jgi:hypothetical protein
MKLDALSISLGILLFPIAMVGLFYFVAYLKNRDRYDIPRFLPRDDEVIWAMVMTNPGRIWSLPKTAGLRCVDWNIGVFSFESAYESRYKTSPTISDVIIAPKKWGGNHALVVTQILPPEGNRYRLVATYIGEYTNERIKSGRTDVSRQSVPTA